ncbi:hypothetical protein DV451_003765 [Geotrichum candidum]|uniref:BD-FAE-like domain-containing protein n=1 Tax=Geotrichum candidum TaxID=1173061 RepID=A0A9P5KTA3_GEOCN|nr:hypothetical protein DV451_003765 [Geotrichum candidum]
MTDIIAKSNIDYTQIKYGDHPLNTIGVYTPRDSNAATASTKWLVFIHGGAWRDPNNTHHDGDYILTSLLSQPKFASKYRGASIDYTLSNEKQHPSFVLDTLAALRKLDDVYGLGDEYILIGHSAGVHIALQTFIYGRQDARNRELVRKCSKVFGIEGIYILDLLTAENEGYRGFTEEAFGRNTNQAWDEASPFTASAAAEDQRYLWVSNDTTKDESRIVPFVNGTLYILHSPSDELLLEKYQPEEILKVLQSEQIKNGIRLLGYSPIDVVYEKIAGKHEEAIKRQEAVNAIAKFI